MSAFEPIGEDEFKEAQAAPERVAKTRTKKAPNTAERTLTNWFALPHFRDHCTVPTHDEVIESLGDEAQVYRSQYPVREVMAIGNFQVCRDCFVRSEDLKHD